MMITAEMLREMLAAAERRRVARREAAARRWRREYRRVAVSGER